MTVKSTNVLILSAGCVTPDIGSMFGEIPSGMIPVNGKPAISWIIDELVEQGFRAFLISVGFKKEMIKEFISRKYSAKCDIRFIEVDYRLAPGNSIIAALDHVTSNDILIVLGDTIFKEKISLVDNFVYTSPDFIEPTKWCLVELDGKGNIGKLYDKTDIEGVSGLKALIGVYYLKNMSLLRNIVKKLDTSSRIEISRILELYRQFENIACIECNGWLDIGHLDKYYKAKMVLANSRYFNDLEVDHFLGSITKKSLNKEKLINEIRWYTELPKEISILAPRILDYEVDDDPYIKMEYYGYPTLSELFVYGDLHIKIWEEIIKKLIKILRLFLRYKGDFCSNDYSLVYIKKTLDRVKEAASEDTDFREIFSYEKISLNGESLLNFSALFPFIEREVRRLCDDAGKNNCLIHGDFCFSNILFDLRSGVIRLIDPRGIWGESAYGDLRYDVAKLRHSVAGKYDLIINDFFSITRYGSSFEMAIHAKRAHEGVRQVLDNCIEQYWDLNQVKLIEGLLFISMIPLHKDNKHRQLAMYCTGLKLLNEVYRKERNG